MRNVTICLKEDLARWVRVEAAKNDTSVSRFVGGILLEQMDRQGAYRRAMKRNLARTAKAISSEKTTYPKREDLYDRTVFRR